MHSYYQYFAAFILAKKLNCDVATARKVKAGEIDPADIEKKPKKTKTKTEGDSEVSNGH